MNYLVPIHKSNRDLVKCPKLDKVIDARTCDTCEYLRVSLWNVIKCTWSPDEQEINSSKHSCTI